ncbi:MAG: ABC transporter ATP-binding protein [Thermoleophilia bacterium]
MSSIPEHASAIEIENLGKRYGAITALDGASLTTGRGQIYGLVGPNGSGKTTLIKAICGLLKPDRGRVRVLGRDAIRERHAVRKDLGYMPQTPSLYDDLSPIENLRFFGGAFRPPDIGERIRETLEFVQLWDRRDDPLHTFSGGMRQRASLACALMHDPELLVLDEPTAGVDPVLRQNFWQHFAELCDRGRTIFLSTNQMDEALRCDHVAVILGGRILVSETPEAIRRRGKALVTMEIDGEHREAELDSYEEELPRLLGEYGLQERVSRISIKRQSLEEVILSLLEEAK